MNLAELQVRLQQHYSRLSDLRATENYPVYAIEHGLSATEISTAQSLLNANLSSTKRATSTFWLVWIAAAAEIGYTYDGTEYWDSFAIAFPSWPKFGDRDQIRIWYRRFANDFRGLSPSGSWAQQFPIISWPITQAILPRYLQRFFADHLYDLRHLLTRSGELTLEEIGELLSVKYCGGSSRFEGFLQQKTLIARIVMAMRLEDVVDVISPIEKITLRRIIDDFDKLGSFGTRLREVRRVLREARFVNSYSKDFVSSTKNIHDNATPFATYIVRPRILARQIGITEWSFSLVIPDIATSLRQAGLSPLDLEHSHMRFRANGEGNAWMPGRALFSYTGSTEEPLLIYPTANRLVFDFDRPLEKVTASLQERLFFPAATLRLLKLRADGTAIEVAGRHVKANQSYLLVFSEEVSTEVIDRLALSPVHTKTIGADVWQFSVAAKLDAGKIAALSSIGLGYKLGIRAELIGLTARWNDVDDTLEFLDTEVVMFYLVSDVEADEFQITINKCSPTRLRTEPNGKTFVSLGKLSVGLHYISLSALGVATGGNVMSEEIIIRVRLATPWQKTVSGKAGVTLKLEPRGATLEQFLDRTAILRCIAPAGRIVKLESCFYNADGTLFHREPIGSYNAPVNDEKISEIIVQKLTSENHLEHVDRSARIEVLISLDEYGQENVRFDKKAEPLRWLWLDERTIRLADDTEEKIPPSVKRYDLDAIEIGHEVDYDEALTGLELRGKGGLFIASINGQTYEVIAMAPQRQISDFKDLDIPTHVSARETQPVTIISALEYWRGARRLIGPMAFLARRNAIRTLENDLERYLCGNDWVEDIKKVQTGTRDIGYLYRRVYYSQGFASGLRAYDWQYDDDAEAAELEFFRLGHVYKISETDILYRLALKLAFQPHAVKPSDLSSPNAFNMLRKNSVLIRGAYFARLIAHCQETSAKSEVV
ncbi:Uncharacterised protein [Klebsiella pneumoniae]|uniref:hypothetical protein n=1 Tax=Enterobacterales TaxID=91347 RepID=UPI0005066AE4|nr:MULTISPECIES: hypothetical protein [Enterobacterales]EKN4190216.1 hypothetical protein [Yersinia enterocolitica]EKN4923570.1 hypothetical protein [Yersinia enterocolitica]ELI7905423.1 hypothetical protein [Yersinia enterocolitica]KGA32598.1 hypothetical protein KS43_15970 [Pectobacterium odoriferum]SVS88858.1 Uncharacterised protein [Klebsiella pneumoniae]